MSLKLHHIPFAGLLSICFLIAASQLMCSSTNAQNKTTPNTIDKGYSTELRDSADFVKLQGPPLAHKFTNVTSVKVVYQLATNKLYFVGYPEYKYHYEFCESILHYVA